MCGRYSLTLMTGVKVPFRILMDSARLETFEPLWNVAPTEEAPIVIEEGGSTAIVRATFRLVSSWAKDVKIAYSTINARAESVHEKPAFREPFRFRRCLVPSDGYFEWQAEAKLKLPWRVVMKDRSTFFMGGIWDRCKGAKGELLSFSIITVPTNGLTAQFHERMPLIVQPKDYATWLAKPSPELMNPFPLDRMEMYRVSPAMNKAAVKGPACVEPLPT